MWTFADRSNLRSPPGLKVLFCFNMSYVEFVRLYYWCICLHKYVATCYPHLIFLSLHIWSQWLIYIMVLLILFSIQWKSCWKLHKGNFTWWGSGHGYNWFQILTTLHKYGYKHTEISITMHIVWYKWNYRPAII